MTWLEGEKGKGGGEGGRVGWKGRGRVGETGRKRR